MARIRWLPVVLALAGLGRAAQVCNLVFDKCPGDFTAGTVTVPSSVIWLDAKIPVCAENIQIQTGTNSAVPSIVFVIDNSGSMNQSDPDESRFTVVKSMLDTIYRVSPTAEVGLVVFTRRLSFDHRENPFFKTAFPGDTAQHDSFVPLTSLNKDMGGGRLAVDSLKALLTFSGNGDLLYATKLPDPRPNTHNGDPLDVRNGTDISLGFEAAKVALKDAKAAKANQYVIFLSDGEPRDVDAPRETLINEFQAGKDLPATFTVFFTGSPRDTAAPPTIKTMTAAIQANGYSATNPRSAYWALNQPGVQLSTLLQNSILNPIFSNTAGKPVSALMTVGGARYPSTAVDAKDFNFGKRIPLSADQTTVNLVYTYSYTDSGKAKSKDVPYALTVKRATGGATLPPGISSACQEQGDIALYSKDTPVSLVTADHTDLDVRLTLGAGETCNGCKVEIKPSKSADKENVALSPAGGYQKGSFGRETNATPVPGNGKLEHVPSDSIIATYVNPDNPLDVIRKAFPYSDVSTRVVLTRHNDYSRVVDAITSVMKDQFVLVSPTGFTPTPGADGGKNWNVIPSVASAKDSLRYIGNLIEASRAFRVEVTVFTNLGVFVNKIGFTVSQTEFMKLSKGAKNGTRQLRVLWNNRAANGRAAGTGGYVMKTTVTLLRIPGVAEDEAETTQYRRIGVLREG
jgi:hypothetical protein